MIKEITYELYCQWGALNNLALSNNNGKYFYNKSMGVNFRPLPEHRGPK